LLKALTGENRPIRKGDLMSRKNVLISKLIEDFSDLSANATSQTINVQNLDNCSIHLDFSGTPTGTIVVQARNGAQDAWYDLALGGGAITLAGAAGSHQILLQILPFTDIQLVYTRTSGTGAMEARITAKTVGA